MACLLVAIDWYKCAIHKQMAGPLFREGSYLFLPSIDKQFVSVSMIAP